MLSVMERMDLITEVEAHASARNYTALARLLDQIESDTLLTDATCLYYRLLCAIQLGDIRRAVDLCPQVDAVLDRHRDSRLFRRYLNVVGILLTHTGRLSEAREKFIGAYATAALWHDIQVMADATMNLGVIADIQGNWLDALAAQTRALVLFESLGDLDMIAGCHHNLGMTYKQLSRFSEALTRFDRALEVFQSKQRSVEAAGTALEKATLLVAVGEPELAWTIARAVYRDVRRIGHKRLGGEAQRALGQAAFALGQLNRSRRYFKLARQTAIDTKNVLLEAEVNEDMAAVAAAMGLTDLRDSMAREAIRLYRSLGSDWKAKRVEAAHLNAAS